MNIVSDPSANADEKIERAAKVLRASAQNKDVFKIVYSGGKFKTLEDIKNKAANFNTNTYKAAARLYSEDIIDKKLGKRHISYGKKTFYSTHRNRILKLSENAKRLKEYPTKRKNSTQIITKTYSFRTKPQAELLLIDDIDSFKRAHKIKLADMNGLKITPERKINRALCMIINQGEKKDWGGERNDIYSNNVVFKGKRKPAAFALKGRATKGILTPNKMGKKADQVQRLFEGTAEIHFVVHHNDIDERVLDQMQAQAINKSIATGKKIYYCPI